MLTAVIQNRLALNHVPAKLWEDQEFVLKIVKRTERALPWASKNLRKNPRFILEAVRMNRLALNHVPAKLWKNREFVLAAVKQNGLLLEHAAENLKKDKVVVLAAVSNYGRALDYASDDLREDREVVLEAVKQNGWTLRYAAPTLQADQEIVFVAVRQAGTALEFASENLKKDEAVALAAVQQSKWAFFHVDESIICDVWNQHNHPNKLPDDYFRFLIAIIRDAKTKENLSELITNQMFFDHIHTILRDDLKKLCHAIDYYGWFSGNKQFIAFSYPLILLYMHTFIDKLDSHTHRNYPELIKTYTAKKADPLLTRPYKD